MRVRDVQVRCTVHGGAQTRCRAHMPSNRLCDVDVQLASCAAAAETFVLIFLLLASPISRGQCGSQVYKYWLRRALLLVLGGPGFCLRASLYIMHISYLVSCKFSYLVYRIMHISYLVSCISRISYLISCISYLVSMVSHFASCASLRLASLALEREGGVG